MARNVLQSSILNAGFSIVFQILCRFITFGINAFIVRNVGREVLGVMNVRLLLLESTLLFLSREAINRAALSATSQQNHKPIWPQIINQMWLTVPICVILCIPCLYIWLDILSPVDDYLEQYRFACYLVAISCVIELCAEAPVFVAQVFCFLKLNISLHTLHILVRSVIFIWMVLRDKNIAVEAFGIAQVASIIVTFIGYYGFFYFYMKSRTTASSAEKEKEKLNSPGECFPFQSVVELLPFTMKNEESHFNNQLQVLTLSFVKQSVLKQILTEGEKYVMSINPVLSFSEQAVYDVVNNLGSLAARFIFRPVEDSSYFYFTQTLSREVVLHKQSAEKVQEAGKVLRNLCLGTSSLGLLAFIFGQNYSYTLLLLYGGADFVAGGLPETLLRWHCLAIFFMAINGVTEGYMFATNTSKDIDRYNYLMAVFSISFLVLAYVLTSIFGPVGFIFANCINMFSRICYSATYISKQYKPMNTNPLSGILPGKVFALTLALSWIVCRYSLMEVESIIGHIGVGALALSLCIGGWSWENLDLIKFIWDYGKKLRMKED